MKSKEKTNRALNPTVFKLGLVAFFADVSGEMLYPITPIFLLTVLGASMTSIGLIEGFAEAMASLLKTYAGGWSDRVGRRKPFVVAGYLLTAAAKPLIGVAQSWPQVLLARGLDRAGKGIRNGPRDALIADTVEPSAWGAAFGWHRAMDTLGAALGPLVAILYLNIYTASDLRGIFFWALWPGLAAVVLTLTVKDQRGTTTARQKAAVWKWTDLSPSFRHYLAAWTIFSLVNSSDVFLLLKTRASGLTLTSTILIYCFYNLVYATASPFLGGLSDRAGRKRVLGVGLVLFALVYAGFAAATQPWHCWLLFSIYGLYMAATDGVGKAYAVDLIDPSRKATAVGLLGAVTGISTLVASTAAGLLWDHLGAASCFFYGAAGALVAAGLLLM